MNMRGFVMLSISIAVAVLTLTSVLVPAVSMAVDTEDTYTNEGLWRMKEITEGDVWTFTSNPYSWEYDDETQSSISTGGSSALLGDNWTVRSNGQARGPYISGNASSLTATAGTEELVFTGVSGTLTYPISGYGILDEGDYIMTNYQKPVHVLGDSIIYATGVSSVDDIGCTIHIEGTIDDGVTITMMDNRNQASISNAEFTNIVIHKEKVEGYVNLYVLSSITADVTFDATVSEETTSHTGSIAYSSYVVPYQVSAEKAIHADSATRTLFQIIPIFVVLGILLAITTVAYVKYRK